MNFSLQPTLCGPRLELQPLSVNDFQELYKVASDPLIWEIHPNPHRYQLEVFRSYFDDGISSGGAFKIRDRDSNQIIGSSRYYEFSTENNSVKIGFTFLARKYWGGAFNRELKHLMLTHAFNYVDRVLFEVGETNFRSLKAMEKIGAQFIFRYQRERPDGIRTTVVYEIRKSEFTGLIAT